MVSAVTPAFPGPQDSPPRYQELAQREGTLPCTVDGCSAMTAIACEYADRRARQCRTAWCPQHRVIVEGHLYCRRHAGVVSALPVADSTLVTPLPDLDNRAPSLVAWVARQLDGDVWRLLLHELDTEGGELIADPVVLVFTGVDRLRAWERAWKLVTHTGVSRRVSLMVEEAHDDELAVKVGANVVGRLSPPWITERRGSEPVDPDTDRREREAFNQRVLDAVERGLLRERELQLASRLRMGDSTEGAA